MRPFDVCGPLPEKTVVLEASAGTGKTYTIAALAARYVAEGTADLSQLMLVTFSRAATQELRERVRERLVSAARGLGDPMTARQQADDDVLRLLAQVDDDEVRRRQARLTRALTEFDAATIATTHGFCQQMLTGLGMAGDSDADATFVERVDDLVSEVVSDLYLRKFARPGAAAPAIEYDVARQVARAAMADRHASLVPEDADAGSPAELRYGIARTVRDEVDRRKRLRRLLDYDDLLTRLRDALVHPERGPAAQERVRSRYRVVLVDEFQDTDPVQWEILRTAFHGHRTLVLIGDPKQAIYAFRGADLVTYLRAPAEADAHFTLSRNWRSDPGLVRGLDAVLRRAALGHGDVAVRPVEAAQTAQRLTGAPCDVPVRLRVVPRADLELTKGGLGSTPDAQRFVAEDVAADVVGLLGSDAVLTLEGAPRPVAPGDIAVLVKTNDQAALVRDQLYDAGVPAVIAGSKSVFLTRPATDWLVLLRAVEQSHRAGLVRSAALTCFVGWSATRLGTADEAEVDRLAQQLRSWRDVLVARGVAALLEVVTASEHLLERLLATPSGERDLTDLRHLGHALHAAALEGQLGPSALVEWLQRRIAEAHDETNPDEERSRRLESDAAAVQVVTVHSSKGLEFPVVLVPFLWNRYERPSPDPLRLHGENGERLLDVGGAGGPGYGERKKKHVAEEAGEDLRLLYVALTRAQCQVVVWWAATFNTATSAVQRVLLGDFAPGEQPPNKVEVGADSAARAALQGLADSSSGAVTVELAQLKPDVEWAPPVGAPTTLAAGSFGRSLDRDWRRLSFTGLTASSHHAAGVASEPEVAERDDEVPVQPISAGSAADEDDLRTVLSPFRDLPGGTGFGTLVHGVLEELDLDAADLRAELVERSTVALLRRGGTSTAEELAAALLPALGTPLGPLAEGLALRDVAAADRLAELDFELPLAGGDVPSGSVQKLTAIARLLASHLPPDDVLAPYATHVRDLPETRLTGYLTGSIDAVLRVRAADGTPRFVVADYKTNWLGSGAETLSAWHYRPQALAESMLRAHYPLQALLYSVALHRYLRWRQPGYDPDVHLGGVLYLYLRGMCGPDTPAVDGAPCGVFSWRPPSALVVGLSDLLAGRPS